MALMQSTESLLQQARTSEVEKKMLLRKISQMSNLPTPSGNVMKVMLLLRDEDVKITQLVPAIEKDQSLVAQILKLVNSGYYGLRKTIESVERAVALLGIINIKHVVYSASIMEFFSDEEQLEWNHSYSTSVLMTNLIKDNELTEVGNLPLAMIMHDLGKVVLRRFSPKKYKIALIHASNDNIPIYRIEDAMLQINHSEVGAMLLQKWDTADEIVKPVLQHHCENIPPDFVFETALVQFVNWVDCNVRGIRCFEPTLELMNAAGIEEIDKSYWLKYQEELIAALEGGRPPQMMKTTGRLQRKSGPVPAPEGDAKAAAKAPAQPSKPEPPSQPQPQTKAPAPTSPIKRPEEPKPAPAQAAPGADQQGIKVFQQPVMSTREAEILKHSYKAPPAPPPQQASASRSPSPPQQAPKPPAPPPPAAAKPLPSQERGTQVLKRPDKVSTPPAASPSPPPQEEASLHEEEIPDTTSTQKISRQTLMQRPQAGRPQAEPAMPVKTQKIDPAAKRSYMEKDQVVQKPPVGVGAYPARPRPAAPPSPPPEPEQPLEEPEQYYEEPEQPLEEQHLAEPEAPPPDESEEGNDSSTQVIRRPTRLP